MDINEYLNNGTTIPNPNYKKPTKKNPGTPKFIQSDNIEDANNGLSSVITASMRDERLGFKSKTDVINRIKSGGDKGLVASAQMTEEDVNRLKAEKQRWYHQLGDFVVQGVANEVVLGTFLGLSNLVDLGINLGKDKGEDDYTNPVSSLLEGWQDSIRKEFEIHRENPNASWNFSDTGWLFDNGVSVLSSASMLIPSIGITKTLGWLGRATKVGRQISKGINATNFGLSKAANWALKPLTKTNRTGRIYKTLSNGEKIVANAFLSRTMENYLEARGVYKEAYDESLAKLQDSNFNRTKFIENNPEFEGKTDEEIASHLASISADETFKMDYGMLMMDIVQFKALGSLWKGKIANSASGGVSEFNRRAAANIGRSTSENLSKVTWADRFNYLRHNPGKATWNAIKSIEFTEGIEEIYQGIQTERGKEVAKRILDPNYQTRTIGDYLTDSSILEQGFWGVIGGVGFKHIANATNAAYTELAIQANQHFTKEGKKWDAKEIALRRMGATKAQIEEIRGRKALINNFKADLANIDNTSNGPVRSNYQTLKDAQGNDILDANGNKIYKELTEEERLQERQDIIDNFITQLTLNAVDAGTFDLLMDYVNDANVKRVLNENAENLDVENLIKQKAEDVYDKYRIAMHHIYNSLDDVDDSVARATARNIVLNELGLETANEEYNDIQAQLNQLQGNQEDIDAYLREKRKALITDIYQGISKTSLYLEEKRSQIINAHIAGEISEQAYRQYMHDLALERKAVLEYAKNYLGEIITDEDIKDLNDRIKDNDILDIQIDALEKKLKDDLLNLQPIQGDATAVPDSIKKLLDQAIDQEYEILRREIANPTTQKEIQDLYDNNAKNLSLYTAAKYMAAAARIRKWLQEQEDLDDAQEALSDGEIKEIQEDLDILKIGHYSTKDFIDNINKEIEKERKRRAKEQADNERVTSDNEEQTGENADRTRQQLDDAERQDLDSDDNNVPLSTGEGTQTDTSNSTEVKSINDIKVGKTYIVYDKNNNKLVTFKVNAENLSMDGTSFDVTVDNKDNSVITATAIQNWINNGKIIEINDTNTDTTTNNNTDRNYDPQTEIDDSGQEVEVTIAQPLEDEAIADVKDQALRDAAATQGNYIPNNDEMASSTAQTTLMDMIKADKSILDILKKGYNTNEINNLIDKLADALVVKGVSQNVARHAAVEGVKGVAAILYNVSKDSSYMSLLKQIASAGTLDTSKLNSSNPFVGKKQVNKLVEQFIDEWVKKNNIIVNDKGHTVINTEKLLQDIINDTNIPYELAKLIIRNMRDYLSSPRNKKYIFDNRKIIYNLKNNISDLIYQIKNARTEDIIIDDKFHIDLPTMPDMLAKAKQALANRTKDSKLTFTDTKGSISIRLDGVEIGYLGKVTMDADGTNIRLMKQTQGFVYSLTPIISNQLNAAPTSNLDIFFERLFNNYDVNYKQILDAVKEYHAWLIASRNNKSIEPDNDNWKELINNPVIQILITKGYLIPKGDSALDKSKNILNHIHNIIYFIEVNTTQDLFKSFESWKRNMLQNYLNTKDIQDRKANGEIINGEISQVNIRNNAGTNYDSNTRTDATTMKINNGKVNSKDNPIVYFVDDTYAMDDNGVRYDNYGEFRVGGAGILLTRQGNRPIIASITDTHLVKETKLYTPIYDELYSIFEDFGNGNLSFAEVSIKLSNLMGGVIDGVGAGANHLLSGITISQNNGRIGIIKDDKIIAMIYKNRKGANQEGTGITHFNQKYNNGKATIIKPDRNVILNLCDEIMDNLKFNISYIMPKNANNPNTSDNMYFCKQNGKFTIKIKGAEQSYDSYTDFLFEHNIPIVNQKVDSNGNVFTSDNITGVYIEVNTKDQSTSPVEGTTNRSTSVIVATATETNPATGTEVAQSLGLTQQEMDIITGQEDGIDSLLPKRIVFNTTMQEQASTDGVTMFIGKKGLTELTSGKQRAIRLLVHERLHQLLKEKGVFTRKNITDDLIDTFERAVEYARTVKPREPHYQAAKTLVEWADGTFNPASYISSLSQDAQNAIHRDAREVFAEEWLVESLTQPGFADFLNSIHSDRGEINSDTKESLWHRIIRALLKIIGANYKDVNNFTILAEHLNILNNSINAVSNSQSATQTSGDTTTQQNTQDNQDNRQTDQSQTEVEENQTSESVDTDIDVDDVNAGEDLIEDDFDINDDLEIFSSRDFVPTEYNAGPDSYRENPSINTTGVIPFSNIESYVAQYPEQYREDIRKMIENNEISFICR